MTFTLKLLYEGGDEATFQTTAAISHRFNLESTTRLAADVNEGCKETRRMKTGIPKKGCQEGFSQVNTVQGGEVMGVGMKSTFYGPIVIYACGVAKDGKYAVGYASMELRRDDGGTDL